MKEAFNVILFFTIIGVTVFGGVLGYSLYLIGKLIFNLIF